MPLLYRLVYNGELVPGIPIEEIIRTFAERFRVEQSTARHLIKSGGPHVLKRDLELERAERYRSVIKQIGLIIDLECQNPELEVGSVIALDPSVEAPPGVMAPQTQSSGRPVNAEPCPKCGAVAVSPVTGVCDACGVVVDRYLSRPGMAQGAGSDNPYAPPQADITPPQAGVKDENLHDPRSVRAGRGWGWVKDAWPLFANHPWAWMGAMLLFGLISIVLGLIPLAGGLAVTILSPIFTAGLMIGAHAQHGGGRFEVTRLFAGFHRNPGRLALLGAAYLGAFMVLGLIIGLGLMLIFLTMGGGFGTEGFDPSTLSPEAMTEFDPLVLLPALFAMLLGVPVMMAMLFAPALVGLNNVTVLRAFKLSFLGCWRNILPFLIYSLVAFGLVFATVLTLGLGLLVVMPLMTIAIYMAYRDIYYR